LTNKKLIELKILSKAGEVCKIEANPNVKITNNGKNISFRKLPDGIIEFKTVKGESYQLK